MPNHTSNELIVSPGDDTKPASQQYKDFLKKSIIKNDDGEEVFTFNGAVPMPDYIFTGNLGQDEREKYGKNNWYDWGIENWGTKWDAYETSYDKHDSIGGYTVFKFQTAWSPPEEYLKNASKNYPLLEFDLGYVLEGYEGCGRFMFKGGEQL